MTYPFTIARAKTLDGKLVEGYLDRNGDAIWIGDDLHWIDPRTIQRNTGFKTSDGTELFTGDKVKLGGHQWTVEWNNGTHEFILKRYQPTTERLAEQCLYCVRIVEDCVEPQHRTEDARSEF